ncbi:primosomal protein N' [Chromatocurvus halotolerans]|uniref:Replication restart protein PriA n=1 Tax=Chromatocurvus halotolerans TaxID=1132028 RepID=A0A4R2KV12_9GAMM|nr:primosomal protein N' [Chromatocurvus halotolerans]TCO76762.1 replication restart DNA helicase PriA [Chromatocurvus halotolerans]
MPTYLRIAVPSPLRRLFDYLPPADEDPDTALSLPSGIRVRVPFGRRSVVGVLIATATRSEVPLSRLKSADAILDTVPLLSPAVFDLCRWASGYYLHPPGEVFTAALSKRLREGRAPLQDAWRLTARGQGLGEEALARAPRQQAALRALSGGHAVEASALKSQGMTSPVLRELEKKGLVERCESALQLPPAAGADGPRLGDAQASAVRQIIADAGSFHCHLLEGVTGSGKTEVYLRAISHCLQQGRQALVLVPEIGLTPQTVARFRERFDTPIALLHSGLTDAERSQSWDRARRGDAAIILGTRSAVFASCPRLGIIIVDEEHDASYKQQDGFRYSARDVAVKRAQLEACPVVLGSATPSLESTFNALRDRYRHHRLEQRAGGRAMPRLSAIDVRRQPLTAGLSPVLLEHTGQALAEGRQVLLFLNRRGFAASLQCHDCGWIADCEHCDARMTVHRRRRQLRCHHCSARRRLPEACPQCGSTSLIANGLGTEQAEDFLQQHFDRWPVYRVDSDSVTGHADMATLVSDIHRGDPCILLGTQMLTKGHHFPGVGLVGVIDSDALLFSADFRGEERLAQLLTQVAGRAGRGDLPGEMLLQTHYPDHPLMQALLTRPYAEIAADLLLQRQERGLPPAGHIALLRTDARAEGEGETFLQDVRRHAAPRIDAASQLIGPLPSAMPRRAGKHRSQLICLSTDRASAAASAATLVAATEALKAPAGLHWFIDIDPLDTL